MTSGVSRPTVRSHVTFGIRGDELNPASVSEELEIQPTSAWRKGDVHLGSSGEKKKPWGAWGLNTTALTSSASIRDHIECILQQLMPHRLRLDRYLSDANYNVSIYVWYVGSEGADGYTVPGESIRDLGSLCNEINFTFSLDDADTEAD